MSRKALVPTDDRETMLVMIEQVHGHVFDMSDEELTTPMGRQVETLLDMMIYQVETSWYPDIITKAAKSDIRAIRDRLRDTRIVVKRKAHNRKAYIRRVLAETSAPDKP